MSIDVTLIDYGIGNLHSVRRALERSGADVHLASTPEQVASAQRLVLPGVGAFADGMAGLQSRDLVEPIREYAGNGKPLLGICLGMQMFARSSSEFGDHVGLNLISGSVLPLDRVDSEGRPQKIPFIGWAELERSGERSWEGSILADVRPGEMSVYLVHSFELVPHATGHRLADYIYGGRRVCAAVAHDNIIGCQFHPEKSGDVGLGVLQRFLAL